MTGLLLHEEILLLALDDEKGTPKASMYQYGMAGGVLTELVVRGRIELQKVKKSLLANVAQRTQTGDPLLDEVVERIRTAKRRASLQTWVGRVAQTRKFTERVATSLRDRGVLRFEEGRVLLFFRRNTWPTQNPAPERELVQRIRSAIHGDGTVDARTATVIALARPCGLLALHFDKAELKARKERIDAIVNGNLVGHAASEAIQAAAAAAMVATSTAVTAATMAATTSAS